MDIIIDDELTLTLDERRELLRRKAYFPFRDWRAVKPKGANAEYFDSNRKAMNFARKNTPAAIFKP